MMWVTILEYVFFFIGLCGKAHIYNYVYTVTFVHTTGSYGIPVLGLRGETAYFWCGPR
jgi:hypothetical protein